MKNEVGKKIFFKELLKIGVIYFYRLPESAVLSAEALAKVEGGRRGPGEGIDFHLPEKFFFNYLEALNILPLSWILTLANSLWMTLEGCWLGFFIVIQKNLLEGFLSLIIRSTLSVQYD